MDKEINDFINGVLTHMANVVRERKLRELRKEKGNNADNARIRNRDVDTMATRAQHTSN